jgi:hypothetical protein
MRAAFYPCVLSLCAMAFATDARAAFISYSAEVNGGAHDDLTGSLTGEFVVPFSGLDFGTLRRFDAALGTLQGVQLRLESTFSAHLRGSDLDLEAESFFPFFFTSNDASLSARMNWGMELNVFDPGTTVIMNRTMADSCSRFEEDIISGPDNDNIGCNFEVTQSGAFNWDFPAFSFPLASFIGADPLNFYTRTTGEAFGVCDFDDDGDLCGLSASVLWSGDLIVTYEYLAPDPGGGGGGPGGPGDPGNPGVPVSEPGTLGVLAAGLALLVLQRRRTRRMRQPYCVTGLAIPNPKRATRRLISR